MPGALRKFSYGLLKKHHLLLADRGVECVEDTPGLQ
jgi:hypothetical protein